MSNREYLQKFMAQQTGLSPTPLLEQGLIAATGPGGLWALTELGRNWLNPEYMAQYLEAGFATTGALAKEQDWTNDFIAKHGAVGALNEQIGGAHYKDFPIQPAEFIEKNKIPFLDGCVIKRMCRHGNKNGAEDLRKAIHEIRLILQLRYGVDE
jgi:hypothetical protein